MGNSESGKTVSLPKLHIAVLLGGWSSERPVSLMSGEGVAKALESRGHKVTRIDMGRDVAVKLAEAKPDVVFNALHGAPGEDGTVQGVLDALGLPYVGSDPVACRTAFDKPIASSRVAAAGLAVPAQLVLAATTFRELGAAAVLDAVVARLGLPLMVKPTRGGSSLGASVVRSADDLPAAMMAAFAYGETALVEQFVPGTEVAVSVLDTDEGPVALPVVEIAADGGFYDYAARYTAGATEFFTPARLPQDVLDACAAAAVEVHRSLGLRHWSRSDLIVDAAGTPWFLEVNVAPGMTETSTFPQAVAAAGLDLAVVVEGLIART